MTRIGSRPISSEHPTLVTHVGTTFGYSNPIDELKKALVAEKHGVHVIADVTQGSRWREALQLLRDNIEIPFTGLPGYYIATQNGKSSLPCPLTKSHILEVTEETLNLGATGITVHASFQQKHVELLKSQGRAFPFTSRMGGLIWNYMEATGEENPFLQCFPDLVALAKRYDAAISLGPALRSPSVVNGGGIDDLFRAEIDASAPIIRMCQEAGVSVILEGAGHILISKIPEWISYTKRVCHGVAMRALPMPTDRAMGHDHISGAIAAAFMMAQGVEVIAIMTRAEHLGLPTIEDIEESVITMQIALNAVRPNMNLEEKVAVARSKGGCHLTDVMVNCIDPTGAEKAYWERARGGTQLEECTMCGFTCPIKKRLGRT
jgi:phosphomethylpyrimidine synthase